MKKLTKKIVYNIFLDLSGSFALAVGIYCFAEKIKIAPGGASGLAIMVKYLTDLPVGIVSFIINVPLLILSFKFLGRRFTARTLRTLIINTIMR